MMGHQRFVRSCRLSCCYIVVLGVTALPPCRLADLVIYAATQPLATPTAAGANYQPYLPEECQRRTKEDNREHSCAAQDVRLKSAEKNKRETKTDARQQSSAADFHNVNQKTLESSATVASVAATFAAMTAPKKEKGDAIERGVHIAHGDSPYRCQTDPALAPAEAGGNESRRLAGWRFRDVALHKRRVFDGNGAAPGFAREMLRTVVSEVHTGSMPCTLPSRAQPDNWLPLLNVLRSAFDPGKALPFQQVFPAFITHHFLLNHALRKTGACLMLAISKSSKSLAPAGQWALEVYAMAAKDSPTLREEELKDALDFAFKVADVYHSFTPADFFQSKILIPSAILRLPIPVLSCCHSDAKFELSNVFVLRRRTRTSLATLMQLRDDFPSLFSPAILVPAMLSISVQAIKLVATLHSLSLAMKDLEARDFHVADEGTLYIDGIKPVLLEEKATDAHASALRSPSELKSRSTPNLTISTDIWQLGFLLYQLWCTGPRAIYSYETYATTPDSLSPIPYLDVCAKELPGELRNLISAFLQKKAAARMDLNHAVNSYQYKTLLKMV